MKFLSKLQWQFKSNRQNYFKIYIKPKKRPPKDKEILRKKIKDGDIILLDFKVPKQYCTGIKTDTKTNNKSKHT